jgi:DNA end-binding protein Ku
MGASRTHRVSPTVPTPRASRSMILNYGVFNIGVAWAPVFKAATTGEVKSHLHCPEHHGQVKQDWYCEHGDHYVPRSELETAFEYAGQSVVLGDDTLAALESERDGIVRLKQSCPASEIDAAYFEKPYLLWPTPGVPNEQAFRALLTAMRQTGKALIGQVVVSKTDRMLVIRWSEEFSCLVAHVCNYAANVKQKDVSLVAAGEQAWADPGDEYVAQAVSLLDSLAGDFDPSAIENTYATKLADALHATIGGGSVTVTAESVEVETPNLLDALRESIRLAQEVSA